jgi:hypothetical protein
VLTIAIAVPRIPPVAIPYTAAPVAYPARHVGFYNIANRFYVKTSPQRQ